MKLIHYYLISLFVILLDQAVKLLVHFTMDMGLPGEIQIFGDWFKLHYTLNPGMAFGMELGSSYGKLILTVFRVIAGGAIAYIIANMHKGGSPIGLLVCGSMILGGAIGNVLDSIFYGVFLDNAPFGSVSPWFHGQVIDMFYIDIWEGILPEWIPLMGGSYMSLWPIFNIADASIFLGVSVIILNQKAYFPNPKTEHTQ
jgi:signal peptidase II